MKNRFSKTLIILFSLIAIFQSGFFIFYNLAYLPAKAEAKWTNPTDSMQIKIPGMEKFTDPAPCQDDPTKTCVPWIGEYISGIYNYAIGIVGILAAVILMWGGFLWLTAGGSSERVSNAKSWITAALSGLVITLTAYLILYQINPDLVKFNSIKIDVITEIQPEVTGCQWKLVGSANPICDAGYIKADENNCESDKKPQGTSAGAMGVSVSTYPICCCIEMGILEASGWKFDNGIEKQTGDASNSLIALLNCMRPKLSAGVGRISSISDSNYTGTPNTCYRADNTCKSFDPPCAHSCTSCHYGRGNSANKSYAVDLGDEENYIEIEKAARDCGGIYLKENNPPHIHISTSDCGHL